MIGLGPDGPVRVFAYGQPCDMRKSFNTLSGLVGEMGHEVAPGEVFVFVSRNRRRAKVLWYDGTGLCLLAKRLDKGQFAAVWESTPHGHLEVRLTPNELRLLLEGCELVGRVRLSPSSVDISRESRVRKDTFA